MNLIAFNSRTFMKNENSKFFKFSLFMFKKIFILQELEEVYIDLSNIVSEAVSQGAEAISIRVSPKSYYYESIHNLL